jgi:hypothetical protein
MSAILQKQIGYGLGVTLPFGVEVVIAYTGRCEANLPTLRAIVKGWVQFQTGAAATGITYRMRRGNGVSGPIIGGTTPTIPYNPNFVGDTTLIFTESLQNVEYADYSFTAQQQGAAGNGTAMLGSIEVELING